MQQTAHIVSIQVGLPRTCCDSSAPDSRDAEWTTAFFKLPTPGPLRLTQLGLEGDGQADRVHHGGPDKALLAYSAEHYPAWRREFDWPGLDFGGFGENLSLGGVDERDVCLGDAWQAGETLIEISQPRQPCWKLARRWQRPELVREVLQRGRTGWYFRVLRGGMVDVGEMTLVERPCPQWTIARCNQVFYGIGGASAARDELASLPWLSEAWRQELQ